MDASNLTELQLLRARAYGPSADIDQDPLAVRRLRDLEARHGEGHAPTSATAGDDSVPIESVPIEATLIEAVPGPEVTQPAESGAVGETAEGTVGTSPVVSQENGALSRSSVTRASRRTRFWWVLSVVAAGSAAAAVTYALTSFAPVPVSHGARQIATLEPSSAVDIPTGWFGAGPSSAVFDFFGLTFFETTRGYTGAGTDCISAVETEQLPEPDADPNSWSIQGTTYSGCRAGAFLATVQLEVDSSVPVELRAEFPEGSALQFVFDGERIGVYLDTE
ncbi:hypothetical protein ACFXQA_12590 [Microbacterium sp. P07]|uniref:hypothetical protein n=1 Tax=Microbacterium sp. P07 TaxID=3366952 RepID=UPI003745BAE2